MSAYLYSMSRNLLRARPWAGLRCASSSSTHREGIARATAVRSGQAIAVSWRSGGVVELPGVWLRDNCAAARDPTTNQKLVSAADLSTAATTATTAAIISGSSNGNFDNLEVYWSDGHVSAFDSRWLKALLPHNPIARGATLASAPTSSAASSVSTIPTFSNHQSAYGPLGTAHRATAPLPAVSFEELVDHSNGEQGALKCADALVSSGLCLVHTAPPLPGVVLDIARRLGPPMHTLYGLEFNVKVDPQVSRVATLISEFRIQHLFYFFVEATFSTELRHNVLYFINIACVVHCACAPLSSPSI